jgi:hypothetical protein
VLSTQVLLHIAVVGDITPDKPFLRERPTPIAIISSSCRLNGHQGLHPVEWGAP